MARQTGPVFLSGTVGDITFYRMAGQFYARRKTSLNRERFYSDRAFERSRERAKVFGTASKIASGIYKMLPREKRVHGVIGKLSGAANRMLHEGMGQEEVVVELVRKYLGIVPVLMQRKETKTTEIALTNPICRTKVPIVPKLCNRYYFLLSFRASRSVRGIAAPT